LWAFGLVHDLRTSNDDERAQRTRESLGFTLSDPAAATLLLALAVPLSCVSVVTYAVAPIAIALTYPIATASILLSGLGPVWGISLFLILISAGVLTPLAIIPAVMTALLVSLTVIVCPLSMLLAAPVWYVLAPTVYASLWLARFPLLRQHKLCKQSVSIVERFLGKGVIDQALDKYLKQTGVTAVGNTRSVPSEIVSMCLFLFTWQAEFLTRPLGVCLFGNFDVDVERKVDTEANLQHLPKAALTKVKEEDPLCPPPPYHGANAEAAVTPNVKTINAQT